MPKGWSLLDIGRPTLIEGTYDSGEAIQPLTDSSAIARILQDKGERCRIPWNSETGLHALAPMTLVLSAPTRSATSIASLRATVPVTIASRQAAKQVEISPIAGAIQSVGGIPGFDLMVGMDPDGVITLDCSTDATVLIAGIAFKSAGGADCHAVQSGSRRFENRQRVDVTFRERVATIPMQVIVSAFTTTVQFAVQGVALVGMAGSEPPAPIPGTTAPLVPADHLGAAVNPPPAAQAAKGSDF